MTKQKNDFRLFGRKHQGKDPEENSDRIIVLQHAMLAHTKELQSAVSNDYDTLMELPKKQLISSENHSFKRMQSSYAKQEEKLFEIERIYSSNTFDYIQSNRIATLFLQAKKAEELNLENIGTEKVIESNTVPDYEQLDLSEVGKSHQESLLTEFAHMPEAQQYILAINSACEKAVLNESKNYTRNLLFRRFPCELANVVPYYSFTSKSFLSFFTKPWSTVIMTLIYCCTLLSETIIAALNAEKLLGFPPGIKSYLFAAFIVGISYGFSFFLFNTVEKLLSKKEMNWILRGYVMLCLVLISCYSILSYYRLENGAKQEQLLTLVTEKNELYDAIDFADSQEEQSLYEQLLREKESEITTLKNQLNSASSEWEKALVQIALWLTGLLTIITGAILLSASKVVSRVVSTTKKAEKSRKKIEWAQMEYKKIYARLDRAKNLMLTLVYLEYRKAILNQLIALKFKQPESYIKTAESIDIEDLDFEGIIPSPDLN